MLSAQRLAVIAATMIALVIAGAVGAEEGPPIQPEDASVASSDGRDGDKASLPFKLYLPVSKDLHVNAGGPHDFNGHVGDVGGQAEGVRGSVDIGRAGDGEMKVRAAARGAFYKKSSCEVVINHKDGWRTSYYHLKTGSIPSIGTGKTVAAGQQIGEAGIPDTDTCGSGDFRHVHFSLYKKDKNGNYQPVAINGTSIGGYTVRASNQGNYCGTWTKNRTGAIVIDNRSHPSGCIALPELVNNQVTP
jgi:murein DD-endopeptidase MepM/ murein hydrolase activator NlpD